MMEVCQVQSQSQTPTSPRQTSPSTANQDQQAPASTADQDQQGTGSPANQELQAPANQVQKAPNQAPPAWYGCRAEHPLIAGIASAIHIHLSIHEDCTRIKNFSANLKRTEPELQSALLINSNCFQSKLTDKKMSTEPQKR